VNSPSRASQFREGGGGGPCSEPLLEGLVETLDLALGLGVVRGAVLLRDAKVVKEHFEGVRAAAKAGGEHEAVEFLADVKPVSGF
jgi:hypothetical protein